MNFWFYFLLGIGFGLLMEDFFDDEGDDNEQ